jgi:hypothetical protein
MHIDSLAKDTSEEAQNILYESLKSMSFADKIDLIKQINKDVESMAKAGINRLHPEYSNDQISYELSRRRFGTTLTELAYSKNNR